MIDVISCLHFRATVATNKFTENGGTSVESNVEPVRASNRKPDLPTMLDDAVVFSGCSVLDKSGRCTLKFISKKMTVAGAE